MNLTHQPFRSVQLKVIATAMGKPRTVAIKEQSWSGIVGRLKKSRG
jgi:hypothetical protein